VILLEKRPEYLKLLTIGYGAVYFSEGSFRSLGIFLPLYLIDPALNLDLSLSDIAFIVAIAYIAWNFKFILGLLVDLTPMIHGLRRRIWIICGEIFRILGILVICTSRELLSISIGAFIALTGDAMIDMGADALLIDTAPPDWHGLGLGAGWASRAFGYSISAIATVYLIINYGWLVSWLVFIIYSMPVLMILLIKEPPLTPERRVSREAIARTFSNTRTAASFFFLAFFSGACYSLDPNRGLLSVISSTKLGLTKATTVAEYISQLPVMGLIMASFGFAAAIGGLIMGAYTDKLGHRKSYYISLTGFLMTLSLWLIELEFIGNIIYPKDPLLGGIVLLSGLLGFFEGWNFVAWETLIADVCPPQLTSFVFQYGMTGTHFSAFLVAFISGYFLENYNINLAITVTLIIVSIGYIPVLFFRPFQTSKIFLLGD